MPQLKQIDPKKNTVLVGGAVMGGFSDGSYVSIERNEDTWTMKVGCDGQGTRVKSNNKSGKVTVTLHQSSASNDVLSAYALADELTNSGAVTFYIRDGLGRTVCSAQNIWVTKPPAAEYGKEVMDRAWVLETDCLEIFLGGN